MPSSVPDPLADAAAEELHAWEAARIAEARASVRAGRTVSHEAVEAWVESWDTPRELPRPPAGT